MTPGNAPDYTRPGPDIQSLDEFLASAGWLLIRRRPRTWFCAVYGPVDEETAITLAYQHWRYAGIN